MPEHRRTVNVQHHGVAVNTYLGSAAATLAKIGRTPRKTSKWVLTHSPVYRILCIPAMQGT